MSNLALFQNTLHTFSFRTADALYKPGQNLVYSPASLSFALGLLLEGSGGLTKKQIINSLIDPRFNGDEKAAEKASNFLAQLGRGHPKGIQKLLSGANFVYSNKDFHFHQSYLKAIKDKFSATARSLDFENASEAARKTINGDVNVTTKGMIPDLLAEGAVNRYTRAVLVNAIHFKGDWERPFDKDDTKKDGKFYLSGNLKIEVPMMKNYGEYELGHCAKSGAKLLKIPYSSGTKMEKAYMVVILPNEHSYPRQYLTNFNATEFGLAVDNAVMTDFSEITLPRFKIESTFNNLETTLKSLGIKDAFSSSADLKKMTSRPDIAFNKVIQRAVIECNEEGTKAAAATAMDIEVSSAGFGEPRPSFHVDRPFIYALVTENKDKLKNILFLGVVENPEQ